MQGRKLHKVVVIYYYMASVSGRHNTCFDWLRAATRYSIIRP